VKGATVGAIAEAIRENESYVPSCGIRDPVGSGNPIGMSGVNTHDNDVIDVNS